MRQFIARLLTLFVCLSTVLQLSGCTTLNAATGRREFIFISTDTELSMGQSFNTQLRQQYPVSQDKAKIGRLQKVGHRIAQVSDRQDFEYHFTLVAQDDLNAFTVPGGYIYFYEGLFDKLSSDDEIAAVLAHEVGHSAAKHTVKKFQAALGYDFVAKLVLSRIGSDVARQLASVGGGFIANVAMSAYGRQDEFEADQLGIKYMRLAGYKLDAMIRTFEILKANSKGPEPPSFLRTHPHLDDRIKAVENEIQGGEPKY
ncbi:MAG: M48 family metalloprotease [Candidatus Omnitrophica bacterium]|nr:M48 family metalloprotease [Candidatus Omnitrophota bacterium]